MLHPHTDRVSPEEAKSFYIEHVRPRMPEVVSMGNDEPGSDEIILSAETKSNLIVSNVQFSILLSL